MLHIRERAARSGLPSAVALGATVGLLALSSVTATAAFAQPIDIAVIGDGESALTRKTQEALVEQLSGLSDFEMTFRFPEAWQLTHGWRADSAREALESALAEESIEIVVALDILSSSLAAELEPEKALIAATVALPELQGFSQTATGTSGTRNLHFLTANFDLADALRAFQRHTGAGHMGLVVDGSLFTAIPSLAQEVDRIRRDLDFELSLLESPPGDPNRDPAADRAEQVERWLDAVPSAVDSLFVTPLPRLDEELLKLLVEIAQERRWPTFTMVGRPQVDAGLLMGQSLVASPEQLARRIAIDIRDLALGRPASRLPVQIETRDRLTINRRTADAIGFRPSFELLLDADILYQDEDPDARGRVLSLRRAVDEALERNLSLALSERDLAIAEQDTRLARSALLPQVRGDLSWNRQDRDLAGTGPTRTLDASVTLSQSIYSETLSSQLRATALSEAAEAATRDATELDVIETAALTYLRMLVAKTERDIQLENLNLTRANLERARFRFDVGSANRSEVLRFEAELGTDRQRATSALAAFERLRFELNRVLDRPIDENFQTEEPTIDSALLLADERLAALLEGPEGVERLAAFFAQESLRNAPELAALRSRIEAQERLGLAAKRRRYVPTIDAVSRANRIVDDGGALFATDFDSDWSVGVELSWSLFAGGGIEAEKKQTALQAEQLELALRQQADLIEAEARSRVVEAASTRLNIAFANSSAEAARQTLDLVTDAYARGSSGYIDLIDAQNTFLSARLAAASAVFQHLQDLVELQRSIAFFPFVASPEDEQAWLDRLGTNLPSTEDAPR
ncbi:MAG: TolC family protein [Acidobacteriota bacterium]